MISRWKASGLHLAISAFVAICAFLLLYFMWYPGVFYNATGGDVLFYLIACIDVIVGPLLTLIVFKQGKKYLKVDLAVIAILQISALVYGLNVVLQARPVYIVFAVDRFVAVSANELEDEDLAAANAPFNKRSWLGPVMVFAQMPSKQNEKTELMFSGVAGKDVEKFPKYYRDITEFKEKIIVRAKSIDKLFIDSEKTKVILNQFLAEHKSHDQIGFIPLVALTGSYSAMISLETAEIIDTLEIDPWAKK